jgi:hypothetical protein
MGLSKTHTFNCPVYKKVVHLDDSFLLASGLWIDENKPLSTQLKCRKSRSVR